MASKKTANKKRVVLLDAHAILHRAYHALPDFTSNAGEPTGGLYGLSAMLIKIINDLSPDCIIAAYDLPEPTYRHEAYEDYKAGRAKADDELVAQMDRSRDVFDAFGIPIYEKGGFEADDILGTIVEQLKNDKNIEIIIASGDLDTLQLVDGKKVQVYTLRKGIKDTVMYDEQGVHERFGFGPELLPDYKGLRGDPSDNIIGVKGIGDKTATELITQVGPIEKIYETLEKKRDQLEQKGFKPRILNILEENKEEAEFSKMLATIRRDVPIEFTLPEKTWRDALAVDKVLSLFAELDMRTLANRVRQLFGGTEAAEENKQEPKEAPEPVDESAVKETAIALWLLRSDITNPTLEDICEYAKTKDFQKAREIIFDELEKENLTDVYEKIEKPLIPIIERMQGRGIKIDTGCLKELSKTYHAELEKIEGRIFTHAGHEFNVNSPKQLAEVIYDELALGSGKTKKTSTGQRSTRESELEKLIDEHPIIKAVLEYRELQKLLSTYIDNLQHMVADDGRLHAEFIQTGTTTGRMASQNPNLQNIPIKSDLGRAIRKAFVAADGFTLAAFDYSQIELRIAAFLSGDEKLMQVFKDGGDVHTAVAAEVFGVAPDEVDYEKRRQAKVINFGILYGMGVNALKQNLETDRKTAQAFLNAYFERFSGLAAYMDALKDEAARNGYTETYFGRRRYFEGITSSLPYVRAQAERMAINAPIQGTEADILKLAMIRVDEWVQNEGFADDVYLLLQVHDELVYEVREAKTETVVPQITEIMESILTPKETNGVPITVDAHVGKNWYDMENYAAKE